MSYNGQQVDNLAARFEKCCERQAASKSKPVKLRAAEGDLLKAAEEARDLFLDAVKGDKKLLMDVFGGAGIQRFHRFRNAMEGTELSDMHVSDQRWGQLKEAMDIIEEVLKQLGMFRAFVIAAPPSSVCYRDAPRRFAPGETVHLAPEVGGGDPTSFSVRPELPEGLELRTATGEIVGQLRFDIELREQKYVVTASNEKGSAVAEVVFSVQLPPPQAVSFPGAGATHRVGVPISIEPEVTGGTPKSWSVSPELPKGLAINPQTGAITGTPGEVAPVREYTVTASNLSGSVTAVLSFSVTLAPPEALSYPDARLEYSCGTVMHLVPCLQKKERPISASAERWRMAKRKVLQREPDLPAQVRLLMMRLHFTVEPVLPEGVVLVESTGVITGSPWEAQEATTYTVTARNDGGEVSAQVSFAVKLAPPEDLRYPEAHGVFPTGSPLSLRPTVRGHCDGWSVEPELPAGLQLDPHLGVISGIPTEEVAEGNSWTVSASNSEGFAEVQVSFAVKRPAPQGLKYPNLMAAESPRRGRTSRMYTQVLHLTKPVEGLQPTLEGEADEFTVEPALPEGLALDPRTGEISGAPTAILSPPATYKVTARNSSGAASTEITFAVKVLPPAGLAYPQVDDTYSVGEQLALAPKVDGGATQWTVKPALPSGLSLDGATGAISGMPLEPVPEASYVVTASNESGGTSAVLTFAVLALAPAGLSYPSTGADYMVGYGVELEPSLSKGAGEHFTVEPALPPGIVLDPKTGAISGEPTAPAPRTTYTVTASNSSGSTATVLTFGCLAAKGDDEEEAKAKTPVRRRPGRVRPKREDHDGYGEMLEKITELDKMPPEPDKHEKIMQWMLWMVHRAWLNDPTLVDLCFANMKMPLPHVEPRIAPKLMKAVGHNTHIACLDLGNTNLQKPQGPELGEALAENTTLRILNIQGNCLDIENVVPVINGLRSNEGARLEELRLANQKGLKSFGRNVEEAMAGLVESHKTIVRIDLVCMEPHWRNQCDKAILRNVDLSRRRRKSAGPVARGPERTAAKVLLGKPAGVPVWEIFPDETEDDRCLEIARHCAAADRTLPTRERLQAFAEERGKKMPYEAVAPICRGFASKLMGSVLGLEVTVLDPASASFTGTLQHWAEKNERWAFSVGLEDGSTCAFSSASAPIVELSEAVAEWLRPAAQ